MSTIKVELLGPNEDVGVIRLNRPTALNALSQQLFSELAEQVTAFDGDPRVAVIVITGNGKAFSAGADLKEALGTDVDGLLGDDQTPIRRLADAKKPLIAAVNGIAFGGGCELVMMCDIAWAAESARFGQPEVLVGTVPGWGGTQRLPRVVGKSLAMELLLSGRTISSAEAKKAGLVSRVLPDQVFWEQVLNFAVLLASKPRQVVRLIKESTKRAFETSLEEGLLFERRLHQAGFALRDRVEGMSAFLEKRKPQWTKSRL